MNNEHIVYVVKKVQIFVIKEEFEVKHYATIYDGGTHLNTTYGETYNEALNEAIKWVHKNFDVPDEITIRREPPPGVTIEWYDETGRLRQGYKEEE